jgi:hypothetical protein
MPTGTALSVGQYLATSFPDLDKEYRDGDRGERSLHDNLHSKTQTSLIGFFFVLQKALSLFIRPELRLKIRPTLYLIPDVCVFHPIAPRGQLS